MAAAALIAIADGDASLEEGAEVGRLMRVLEVLRDHDPSLGVESYLHHVDALRKDPAGAAKIRAKVVSAAAGDMEAAALLIVICHAISESDGVVRTSEIDEIRTLASLVGVDPRAALDMIVPEQTNV